MDLNKVDYMNWPDYKMAIYILCWQLQFIRVIYTTFCNQFLVDSKLMTYFIFHARQISLTAVWHLILFTIQSNVYYATAKHLVLQEWFELTTFLVITLEKLWCWISLQARFTVHRQRLNVVQKKPLTNHNLFVAANNVNHSVGSDVVKQSVCYAVLAIASSAYVMHDYFEYSML